MKFSVSLSYKDLFSDYEEINIIELLEDIPTVNALELISYFMVQIHLEHHDKNLQIDLTNFFIQRFPQDLKNKIIQFYSTQRRNSMYSLIDNLSGLFFIENILKNHNDLPRVSDLTPEQELNFFKAYLLSTQIWIDKKDGIFSNLDKISTDEDFNKAYIPTHIPYYEFNVIKDIRLQFAKAKEFFTFCEQNKYFKDYLNFFLQEYGLKSWQEYLKNILSLYLRKFDRLKTPSEIEISDDYVELQNFLSLLSLNMEDFKMSDDFYSLRKSPIYKANNNRYIFLSLNLFVDKIFQGIQFDFARIVINKKGVFKDKPIKSIDQFFSIVGDEFSETNLFYNIIKNCFSKSNYVLRSGLDLKNKNTDGGEPDFYIRDKAKVYLFEFKNVLLNSKVKHSFDYEKIEEALFEKFIENKNKSKKGIGQLIELIKKIDEDSFDFDDSINLQDVIIYPIIVFTDISLNTPGVNNVLNNKYKELIKDFKLTNIKNLQDVTLIDLDTLIKYQDLFFTKKIKINNLLNEYHTLTNSYGDFIKRFTAFEMFIENKTHNLINNFSEKSVETMAKTLGIE
ncbi:hypothetical protein [Chryseobacterium nepalense]|uniref:hypothetical protein n=1 Tax=Chryseobacterium nepalense TaxID=1854498 RepID=UPI002DFF1834|nr:hypothetical protein [Chryseobacterium nepalense]